MATIKIMGCDPSLRNLGVSLGTLDLDTLEFTVEDVTLTVTEKSKVKSVRKSSDDYDRCKILHESLRALSEGVDIAFVEMPIGSQSAAAMLSYGACISLIASLTCPVIQVTPTAVKVKAVGDKNATKDEMIKWASGLFPNVQWLRHNGRLTQANEHIADSIGAINAGLKEPDFQALVAMMKKYASKTA